MAFLSDITPDFVFEQTRNFHVVQSRFENRVTQRRKKTANKPRIFKLVFVNRPKRDFTYVDGFLKDRTGSFEAFTWTSPQDSTTYTVNFIGDSFKLNWQSFNSYNFEFEIEENI